MLCGEHATAAGITNSADIQYVTLTLDNDDRAVNSNTNTLPLPSPSSRTSNASPASCTSVDDVTFDTTCEYCAVMLNTERGSTFHGVLTPSVDSVTTGGSAPSQRPARRRQHRPQAQRRHPAPISSCTPTIQWLCRTVGDRHCVGRGVRRRDTRHGTRDADRHARSGHGLTDHQRHRE